MLLSLLKAARESIRLAKRKEHNILRSQSVKKLSLFDGEDPPSEILRDFRRKERSDSYPLRTAQSAPQRAYPRTSVSTVCRRMEQRRDGKCIFAVFRRPDAKRRAEGARTVRSTPQPRNTGRGFAVAGAKVRRPDAKRRAEGARTVRNTPQPRNTGHAFAVAGAKIRRPDASGGLKGRGQCEALRSPGTPGAALT